MYDKRFRNWFLTINNDAHCFSEKYLISKLDNYNCDYALILHDKDNEEQPHYHVWIKFENGRTFCQLKKVFEGAHIEIIKNLNESCKYLCHRTLTSKEKYQYSYEEVYSNFDYCQYIGGFCDSYIDFEINEYMLLLYKGEFTLGLADIILRYGLEQYKKNRLVILDLLKDYTDGLHLSTYEHLKTKLDLLEASNEEKN